MSTKWSAFAAGSAIGASDIPVGLQSSTNVQWTWSQVKTFTSASPTLVTPTLGVATATSINKVALTAPATSATLTIADGKTATFSASITVTGTDGKSLTVTNSGTFGGGDAWVLAIAAGKTLTVSNSITLAGTDSTVMTFPSTSATMARTDASQSFTGNQTFAGTTIFSVAASGPVLKQGANGRVGTFTANGVTPVVVSNSSVAATDAIIISLNTVGGTPVLQPYIATLTASTGFTVIAGVGDSSTYNYAIIKNAA